MVNIYFYRVSAKNNQRRLTCQVYIETKDPCIQKKTLEDSGRYVSRGKAHLSKRQGNCLLPRVAALPPTSIGCRLVDRPSTAFEDQY
jgi:hypothetical protein